MSPLTKRIPREIRNNLGKYLGIFVLMALTVAVVSGFLVAASSIQANTANFIDDYTVEDGRFTTNFQASEEALAAVEGLGCEVHELFSFDTAMAVEQGAGAGSQATVRLYLHREALDLAAYAQGEAPGAADEVALDRVFAANAGVGVGDEVTLSGKTYRVSGIMTLPDYTASFLDNSDFTINGITFGQGELSSAGYDALLADTQNLSPSYTYAFRFDDRSLDTAGRVAAETEMMSVLSEGGATVTDFIDRESNQGISYALSDVEGDSGMWEALFIIIVAIMAFVFVVLTGSTVESQSAAIGTLLAMGYTRGELVRHYLAAPVLVGVLAGAAGNLAGYGLIVNTMKDLYYNSYNLPPFSAVWDWHAFLMTTVVPLALLVGITLVGLVRHMRATPLQFLRHEAQGKRRTHSMPLPAGLPFASRLRLRLFARNLGNYVVLFCGMAFATLILLFGLCLLPTMTHYADQLGEGLPAEHEYLLKAPLKIDASDAEKAEFAELEEYVLADEQTRAQYTGLKLLRLAALAKEYGSDDAVYVNLAENSDEAVAQAERFAAYSFETPRAGVDANEQVSLFGVGEGSRYFEGLELQAGKVVITPGVAQKCGLAVGDTMSLTDKYHGVTYELEVAGTWGNDSTMGAYLSLADFNDLLGNAPGYFNGYLSDEPLNLDARYVASEVTPATMRAVGDQMVDSMNGIMSFLVGMSVAIFLVLMYLLTKTVIDRAARSISYMKVFGYTDREISRLYVRGITATVAVSLVACLPLVSAFIVAFMRVVYMKYSGNITPCITPESLALDLACGLATYAVVAWLHLRTVRRVPLALALKVQE